MSLKNCNDAFWDYVEMLEESSKELYQQLNHVSLENWDGTLKERVTQINELLINAVRKTPKDLKGYLQDFFAAIQRASQDESMGKRKSKQFYEDSMQFLLEYRMLFAHLFDRLKKYSEGRVLLSQLYFIERYFESIETKLAEIKTTKQIS